jgi:CxxC motif-containing protein (DUF1111 family)
LPGLPPKDGRGHPPAGPDDSAVSMFLRLSIRRATTLSGRFWRIIG